MTSGQRNDLHSASVDAVICSLFFHHLYDPDKNLALSELNRVMRPGASLLVADWGRARSPWTAAGFLLVRGLDGFARSRSNGAGRLSALIEQAGFSAVAEFARVATVFGEVQLLSALRSGSPSAVVETPCAMADHK